MRRILIVHPDAEIRTALEDAVRAADAGPQVVEGAASLADGLRRTRALGPHVVFVHITGERALALQAVSEMRAPGRLIVALYDPLVLQGDVSFLRDATRAGAGDFVPLPAPDAEVQAALAAFGERQTNAPEEGRVVTFFSQQGGVGTTTLAVNVALLLAGSDQVDGSVVLCDAAVPFGGVSAFLGLTPERGLGDFVRDSEGGAALAACLTDESITGLKVLAAPGDPLEGDRISPQDMTRVLMELRRRFRWVVVDTPPVLDLLTLAVLDSSDRIFVVTEAVTPTILGTERLLALLEDERLGGDRIRLVLNRFNGFEGLLSERAVVERLGRTIDHLVPYDRSFVTAATRGRPVVLGRPASAVEAALSRIGEDAIGQPAGQAGVLR